MGIGEVAVLAVAVGSAVAIVNLARAFWMVYRKAHPTTSVKVDDDSPLRHALSQSVSEHWVLFLVEGIVLVVLGLLAIVIPPIATIAVTIFLGWLFLISGIVGLVTTFWASHVPGFWWSLLLAVLAIAAGIVLLGWPVRGTVSLTLLLIVFFIIEGVLSIMYAFEHKKVELSGRWGWMLVSGIIDLILAAIIWAGLPSTAGWALGLLVGINMLFGGAAMIAMALHARSSLKYQQVRVFARSR
jgi:uncharacterized membrane protein HdeD (DUF308 family)